MNVIFNDEHFEIPILAPWENKQTILATSTKNNNRRSSEAIMVYSEVFSLGTQITSYLIIYYYYYYCLETHINSLVTKPCSNRVQKRTHTHSHIHT